MQFENLKVHDPFAEADSQTGGELRRRTKERKKKRKKALESSGGARCGESERTGGAGSDLFFFSFFQVLMLRERARLCTFASSSDREERR